MKRRLSATVVIIGATLLVAGCGSSQASKSAVAIHLNKAGCDPGSIALPASKVTLQIINDAGSGEFDVQNSNGDSVAKLDQIDQGEAKKLPLDL